MHKYHVVHMVTNKRAVVAYTNGPVKNSTSVPVAVKGHMSLEDLRCVNRHARERRTRSILPVYREHGVGGIDHAARCPMDTAVVIWLNGLTVCAPIASIRNV